MNDKKTGALLAVVLLALVWLPVVPTAAGAMDPMTTIQAPIDTLIAILNDPQYQVPGGRASQRDEIWKHVKPMFDFHEVSRRTVARNWSAFTDAEKNAFTDVFSQFLGNTYIDKIQGEYHNEKIVFLGQAFHSDLYAEVRTQIIRETVQVPVDYRMIKGADGRWKVYDVIVEGVSLVKNYRTQFDTILQKETPAQLIERLDRRLAEQNGGFSTTDSL